MFIAGVLLLSAPALGAVLPSEFGHYALHGTAHVTGNGLADREVTADLWAEVSPGRAPSEVRVELGWRAYRCAVEASLAPSGELAFAEGQACQLFVAEPEARGPVEGRLRSGRGRLRDGLLELELAFEVSGTLQARLPGRRITFLGTEVELPDTWMPGLPVHGSLTSSARGSRNRP